jgi:stearoyl-CoA desaturase (Delta-9 desaturase)
VAGVFDVPLVAALLVAFVVTQVANLATTLYLHRSLAHRALTLHPALVMACRWVLWVSTGIDRREWVAVHRKHHVHTDGPDDPHSPIQRGWRRVLLFNVVYYRRAARQDGVVDAYGRDLPPDALDRVLFRRSLLGLGVGVGALVALFGPAVAVLAGATHMVAYLLLSGAVNSLGHHFGRRPHDNTASNLRWLAALTGGEGMHNDHHEYPRSPFFGDTWWDLGGRSASALGRMRLARLHVSGRRLRQAQLDELGDPASVGVG